jgi:hypothetical protein
MRVTRRKHLAALGGGLLAAGAMAAPARGDERQNHSDPEVLYGHGMVWNRDLPGEAGELKLSFDLRVNLETGVGLGTAHDPVHPHWNLHFNITSTQQKRLRGGRTRFMMEGVVTHAATASNVGLPVAIAAEVHGDATSIAIRIGDALVFGGAGLVVIAIIAVLIGLLVPHYD